MSRRVMHEVDYNGVEPVIYADLELVREWQRQLVKLIPGLTDDEFNVAYKFFRANSLQPAMDRIDYYITEVDIDNKELYDQRLERMLSFLPKSPQITVKELDMTLVRAVIEANKSLGVTK